MADEDANQFVPIVDLGGLDISSGKEPSEAERQRVGKELVNAFETVGFVYLKGHGVPTEHFETLEKAGEKFFSLPLETKQKYQNNDENIHGYVPVNAQKIDRSYKYELRESYDLIWTEDTYPDEEVPEFRQASLDFKNSCKALTNRLLVSLALGLDIDRDYFLNCHRNLCEKGNMSPGRVAHYPPVDKDKIADTIRIGAHCDYGTMTFVYQNKAKGLQVRDNSGNWVYANHVPGAILLNAGETLQYLTSGRMKATEHRVIVPPDEEEYQKSRRSVLFFITTDDEFMVVPIDGSSDFEPVTTIEFLLRKLKETYDT